MQPSDLWKSVKNTYDTHRSKFKPQDDFIGLYDSALPAALCDEIVANFEIADRQGDTSNGFSGTQVSPSVKKSIDITLTSGFIATHPKDGWLPISEAINKYAQEYVAKYFKKYFMLLPPAFTTQDGKDVLLPEILEDEKLMQVAIDGMFSIRPFNIQRYQPPTDGYFAWHFEQSPDTLKRVLFIIIYLNDVSKGGETEFYFTNQSIAPVKGRLVIAPGGFSHTHRMSIEPLSNTKYILTSWIEYK